MCSEPGFGASVSGSLTTIGAGSPSRPRLWAARRWPRLRLLPHPLRFCAGTATSSQPSTMAARTGAQADLRTATEGHQGWSSVTERFKPIKNGQGNDDERDMPVVSKNTNEL